MGKNGIENRVEQMKSDSNPFYAGLRLGGLYDSRVGSTSDGKGEGSDTALAATLSAGWQAPIESNFGFRVDYSGYADFHQDFDEYDVIDQSISFEPQYTTGKFTFSLPVALNYALEDGERDYNKYTASPTLTYLIPQTDQAVSAYGIFAIIDDKENPLRDDNEQLILDENGDTIILDEDANLAGIGCAYVLFFENSSRIRLSLAYQHSTYDAKVADYNDDEIISLSTEDREDDTIFAGIDIQYQFTKYVGVYSNYSFIHSNSNADDYEYDRNIIEAGIALKY